jgi:hypothetical protein
MRCSLDDLKISCRKIYGGIAGVILDGHARFLFFALPLLMFARHPRRVFAICRTIRCALQDALNASTHGH